eukprot:gene8105-9972_t
MNIYTLWMTKFGALSPLRQVAIMVGMATISSDILAALAFYVIGLQTPYRVVGVTTVIVVLVSLPLGAFLIGLNFKLKQLAAQLDLESRRDDLTGLLNRAEFYLQTQRLFLASRPMDTRTIGRELELDRTPTTVSIGIALHEPGQSLEETLAVADKYLYSAKHQGRNRVGEPRGRGFAAINTNWHPNPFHLQNFPTMVRDETGRNGSVLGLVTPPQAVGVDRKGTSSALWPGGPRRRGGRLAAAYEPPGHQRLNLG